MQIRGLVRTSELAEDPPGSGNIELVLKVQGVGAGQPRTLVVPYALLLQDDGLEPESVQRRAFDAEAAQDERGRWVVARIDFAARILRPPD